ncbi:UNVERIFIED_CONTAM: hypothetical protein Sradi_4779800 [Sesamum radiatum]|uniref:Uncharacterized protein n=1 Tax=Sesamum radiatum TaxID=300843 RepID=A0AAW2MXY6_SESRA
MADHTTRRRILAAQYAQSPMDPPPKPTTKPHHRRRHHHHHHPVQDRTDAPPSSVQNMSDRFSKLYISHKKLADNPPSGAKLPPHPQPDPQFHQKPLPPPPFLDATKSNSRHERNTTDNQAVVRVVDEIKKPLSSEKPSVESDKVEERFEQGLEVVRRGFVNAGGIRKSFSRPGVELHDFFSCSGVRVVAVDMNPYMQIHAVDCARKARDSLEKFTSKTLALTLKKVRFVWFCVIDI